MKLCDEAGLVMETRQANTSTRVELWEPGPLGFGTPRAGSSSLDSLTPHPQAL